MSGGIGFADVRPFWGGYGIRTVLCVWLLLSLFARATFGKSQYHLDTGCCDVCLEKGKKQNTLHVVVIPIGYRQGYRCFKFDSTVGDAI